MTLVILNLVCKKVQTITGLLDEKFNFIQMIKFVQLNSFVQKYIFPAA